MAQLSSATLFIPMRRCHHCIAQAKAKSLWSFFAKKFFQIQVSKILHIVFQDWELLVLSKLKWDLSAITPHDFLEQILSRLPIDRANSQTIKRHAQTFVAICSTGRVSQIFYSLWNKGVLTATHSTTLVLGKEVRKSLQQIDTAVLRACFFVSCQVRALQGKGGSQERIPLKQERHMLQPSFFKWPTINISQLFGPDNAPS